MQDLIYCNDSQNYDEISNKLKKKFSDIKITDASDDVHEYRFSVELLDSQRREYRKFIIEEGLSMASLSLALIVSDPNSKRTKKEDYDELMEVIKEIETKQKEA